jgi:acetolactate synthase-1/2/3 large subunit
MAEAHGKLTGRPGVAVVTRGPGRLPRRDRVHVAQQDSTPLVLLVGQIPVSGDRPRELPGGGLPPLLLAHREMG